MKCPISYLLAFAYLKTSQASSWQVTSRENGALSPGLKAFCSETSSERQKCNLAQFLNL